MTAAPYSTGVPQALHSRGPLEKAQAARQCFRRRTVYQPRRQQLCRIAAAHVDILLPIADAATTITDAVTTALVAAAPLPEVPIPIPTVPAEAASEVWQSAAAAVFKGGAAAAAAAFVLKLLNQNIIPSDTPVDIAPLPPRHLNELPPLALAAGIAALRRPASLLLPATAALYCIRCAGETVTTVLYRSNASALQAAADPVAELLGKVDQLTGAGATSAASILLFWVVVVWKDEVLKLFLSAPEVPDDTSIIAGPLNAIASTGFILTGALSVAGSFGINLEPVMAVGGISTILLGFGSQIVTANAVSGIDLFISQTFVKGDRITLMTSSGETVVTGIVEAISLLYTTIRTDAANPVSVPNKAVAEMLVRNEAQARTSSAMRNYKHLRQLQYSFRIRLEDEHLIRTIVDRVTAFLQSSPDVSQADVPGPPAAWYAGKADWYIELGLLAYGTKEGAASFGSFRQDVLHAVDDIIRKAGAATPVPTSVIYNVASNDGSGGDGSSRLPAGRVSQEEGAS